MRFALLSPAILILMSARLPADEGGPIELTIHPRAIETPVLKYRLLPGEAELTPGNAAPILLRMPWDQTHFMTQVFPTFQEWESRPLSALEWESSGGVLPSVFYSEMKRAAFREYASWEYPIRETQSPYLILLPDVQGMRGFLGHGLSARIRYHLSRGELDEAREGIVVGLANTRHLAQTPFLITQLVAIALHRIMLDRTAELISQPGSPNLYWALSTLPDSLIELDRAASLEASMFSMTFPAVNDLDRQRAPAEWSRMAAQLIEVLHQLGEIPKQEPPQEGGSVVEQLLKRLSPPEKTHLQKLVQQARAELPALLDIPPEKVAAMSDDEAAVRWYVYKRIALDHQTSAVLVLPAREAWPRLKELQDEIAKQEATGARKFDFLSPVSIYVSAGSLNRRVQALRIIEAVRHHLAIAGELPAALSDIRQLSIPVDPLTDQPFHWAVDGNTATLKAPPLPADVVEPDGGIARSHALEYRLHVK